MNAEAPRKRGRPKVNKFQEAAKEIAAEKAAAEPVPVIEPRKEMRTPMREEDPRTRAARRAAEIRNHVGTLDEGTDEFYVPPEEIPDGWTYEWKRKSVFGKEDPAHQVQLARMGWEAVPASRHPSMMPDSGGYNTIERKGMILMERPAETTEEARKVEMRRARMQVRQKEEQLNSAPSGQFERNNKENSLVKVKKSYEAVPIPKD